MVNVQCSLTRPVCSHHHRLVPLRQRVAACNQKEGGREGGRDAGRDGRKGEGYTSLIVYVYYE
ncbi:hypothetical protein E2C01_082740 [Portunus trituberculatus]|uniref:Uncharacterized protein n=1 Tax=Portunus trituberculatus TaxID=210409 RepID=A0A5B7IQQ9_PORTR|nr:hypothetical protein [Portunus trituberculatus]